MASRTFTCVTAMVAAALLHAFWVPADGLDSRTWPFPLIRSNRLNVPSDGPLFDLVTIVQKPPPFQMRGNMYVEGAKSHIVYAELHGYDYHVSTKLWPGPERPSSWHKVDAVRHAVWEMLYYKIPTLEPKGGGWIWWTDSDIFIKNMSKRLEDIVNMYGNDPNTHLIIARDCLTINGGSMLYRASEWTLSFLDKVSSLRGTNLFDPAKYYSTWEQGAINYLCETDPDIRNHTNIIHGRVFNSYAAHRVSPCDVIYQPGDFVIHYSGAFGRSEYFTNGTFYKKPFTTLLRFASALVQSNVSRVEAPTQS
ncbi:hypothetical protein DUNSADRAFT_16473 [Dunaliella salina]|uniref:Uncharacterized protein n=1 Tax=Dunaliella salina TaxID=3046 RepID=A0ABQ7H109_DUNSA|nr:hypothetical protein DUNSADRAFT_16473 [Dunaliella salina]|eukprot:KAF5840532.1 hypothetical protein DUNSADRAFT_16473 [Dunaliella salina]